MTESFLKEIITRAAERWLDCQTSSESTLLRLAILREIVQSLHSEKSRCLANGLKSQAQVIKTWETKIEELRDGVTLDGDLLQLIDQFQTIQKKKRILPESLFQHLERDKLLRYDRQWEAAIAAEGLSHHWKLWTFHSWVEIPLIEEWSQAFAQRLWPHGLILFTESAHSKEADLQESQLEPLYWKGRWTILLDSHFKSPAELSLNVSRWPGSPIKAPATPQWKKLYP
jgi:hypothetical protein